jgi:tryptophan-rich sensory protein
MAATWTGLDGDATIFQNGRPDYLGAVLNAVVPLAGLAIVTGGAEAAGLGVPTMSPLGLPAWTGTLALIVMLPMWGIARWLAGKAGRQGRAAARWIVALIVVAIMAPFAVEFLDPLLGSAVFMVLLLIGLGAISRAAMVSGVATALLLPGLLWTGAGAIIAFGAVAGGWSPPFALTNSGGH